MASARHGELDVLDPRAAAELLGMHEETVRRLARERKIPAYKVGGLWRFSRSMLYRWAEAQQTRQQPRRVLVVDDELAIRETVKRILEAEGYVVATAARGQEALEHVRRETPDAVLLDLKLPGMDGPATLREMRRLHATLPVIILTGYPDSDLMTQALEHSPVMLLAKPVDPDRMIEAVRCVMARP